MLKLWADSRRDWVRWNEAQGDLGMMAALMKLLKLLKIPEESRQATRIAALLLLFAA